MRRWIVALFAALLLVSLPGVAGAHGKFDHAPPAMSSPGDAPSSTTNSGPDGVEWELVTTLTTGNPHTDIDFFTQGGDTFASVGTLATGPNGGGQSIVRLTEAGELAPAFISGHGSATCISNPEAALGLQHDVEATPKGDSILNTTNPFADRRDAQLIIDATDAEGRCHDQSPGGFVGSPPGGLEIVDITDPENPVEIGLTSHIGEAHTVNVDPKRPHIAYAVSSDSVSVDDEGTRTNEESGLRLDGFEVVDLSSCMDFPEGTTVEEKREACRPEVFRYRYPTVEMALGHTNQGAIYGCHELEVYPDDRLTCGGGAALIVLDMAAAFDDNGTPNDFSDDVPNGEPLPCAVRPSASSLTPTGAMVTDCVTGGTEEEPVDLTVSGWLEAGAPSLEGVEHLGSVHHMGRESATGAVDPAFPSTEDIDFNHEAELTHSGRFLLATDERGGGVLPPGASCSPGADNSAGNGGIHAYAVDRLDTTMPDSPEEAHEAYARTPEGGKAVYRAPVRTVPHATICTAHVFQQIPGQNRIFMGWYSQGTQVVDYTEHPDGTIEFEEVGFFIPENANTWVSHVFHFEENQDGSVTYFGATGDFALGEAGRNSIDIYQVTLPAPPEPLPLGSGVCDGAPVAEDYIDRDDAPPVHQPSIDCAIFRELAQGSVNAEGQKVYRPREDVTRAQMASFIVNTIVAAGFEDRLSSGEEDRFDDIADVFPEHRRNINRLADLGIVEGTGDRIYSPDGTVSRQQMASFMVRTAEEVEGEPFPEPGDHFGDVAPDNRHHHNINAGFEQGLFVGTTAPTEGEPRSGTFSPSVQVPRDQMASFLVNLLARIEPASAGTASGSESSTAAMPPLVVPPDLPKLIGAEKPFPLGLVVGGWLATLAVVFLSRRLLWVPATRRAGYAT